MFYIIEFAVCFIIDKPLWILYTYKQRGDYNDIRRTYVDCKTRKKANAKSISRHIKCISYADQPL